VTDTMTQPDAYAVLTGPTTLQIQRVLPGPIERVWAYLTESALRQQWLASGDIADKIGGAFDLTWRNDELTNPPGRRPDGMSAENTMTMRLTAFDPPRKLAYDWIDVGHVDFDLQAQGDKVLLTLTHSRATEPGTRLGVSAGWHAHLDVLAAKLEGRTPAAHWDHFTALREAYRVRYGM
jgi:uncharacterized protein YndB with AHSA1/START domain